jgi:hypothetical protein
MIEHEASELDQFKLHRMLGRPEFDERLLSVRLLPGTHILKAEVAKLHEDRLLVGRRKLHPA